MRRLVALLALLALFVPRLTAEVVATLRVGDVFEMRLGGMPDEYALSFSHRYTVGPGGTINVPLIGEIKAVGLTTPQLERVLQSRFVAAKVFSEPTVTITVAPDSRIVSVNGGVKNPQRVPWTTDLTLTTAIWACGGPSEFASPNSPKGVRVVRNSRILAFYNLKEIDKDPSKDPKLLPGDLVTVRE